MKRRKLDAGNFPSWEERIDYQLHCAMEKGHDLRATDLDLYSKVGYLEGRADRAVSAVEVGVLRAAVRNCVVALVVLAVLCVALTAAVIGLVIA